MRLPHRARLAVLGFSALIACSSEARGPLRVEIVLADGSNPASGVSNGRVEISVAEAMRPIRTASSDVRDGTFSLDVPIDGYANRTEIGVRFVRDGVVHVGRTGSFLPFAYGFVRVPVVPEGACRRLVRPTLASERHGHTRVAIDALLLDVGGLSPSGPSRLAERGWLPLLTSDEGAGDPIALDAAPGRAEALRLAGQARVVVLGDTATLLNLASGVAPDDVQTPLAVHAGARAGATALVDLGTDGVAFVGGESSNQITWLATDRSVQSSSLPAPRGGSTAIRLGGRIVVGGGNAAGEPTMVAVPIAAALRDRVVALGGVEVRRGGVLVAAPNGEAALLVGGTASDGRPLSTTLLLRGCPDACEVVAGPAWPTVREGVAVARGEGTAWLVGGHDPSGEASSAIDRIVWSGSTPRIEAGPSLELPRDEPAAMYIRDGVVSVSGGQGRSDQELCVTGSAT